MSVAIVLAIGLINALAGFTLPMALIISDRLLQARVAIGVFNAINALLWTVCYNNFIWGTIIGFGVSALTTLLLYVYRVVSRSR